MEGRMLDMIRLGFVRKGDHARREENRRTNGIEVLFVKFRFGGHRRFVEPNARGCCSTSGRQYKGT